MTDIISITNPYADYLIRNTLMQTIATFPKTNTSFVFFCIGTNQIIGDSLGPLIGSWLNKLNLPNTFVYGTWEKPVHALNLSKILKYAKKKHPDACFIAIDASFGSKSHLDHIFIDNAPLYPGSGVGKDLPPVGDISITGVVCQNCMLRHRRLKQIPASTIYSYANAITSGIFQTLLYFSILQKT